MTPDHESLDSNHGHEYPVRELRVLLWDILCALVGISTRTPYCSTVCRLCPCVSITHSLTLGPVITTILEQPPGRALTA